MGWKARYSTCQGVLNMIAATGNGVNSDAMLLNIKHLENVEVRFPIKIIFFLVPNYNADAQITSTKVWSVTWAWASLCKSNTF